ncbi:MAG: hypothetical protein ACREDV_09280 [Methylocella sp.]
MINAIERPWDIAPGSAEDLARRAGHIELATLSAGYTRRAPPDDFREQLLLIAKMPLQSLLRRAGSGSARAHAIFSD